MSLKLVLTARAGKHKYSAVNGYLLTEKPANIRIWGTFTLLGRLFDMASDGENFELSLPTRNQFIVGRNDASPGPVKNPLENIRPQIIRNALLINPIAPQERAALDPAAAEDTYDVLVLAAGPDGTDRLVRRITFSRTDLLVHAQVIYDADGVHATHAVYDHYTLVDSIPVPTRMTIARPKDDYSLALQVAKNGVVLNRPFPQPNTFQLVPPAGATVIHLGEPPGAPGKRDSGA